MLIIDSKLQPRSDEGIFQSILNQTVSHTLITCQRYANCDWSGEAVLGIKTVLGTIAPSSDHRSIWLFIFLNWLRWSTLL